MDKIKIRAKSNRHPYWRGGVNFQNGNWIHAEVDDNGFKYLMNDPEIEVEIIEEEEVSPTLSDSKNQKGDSQASFDSALADKIFAEFKNFKDEDFKQDGDPRISAVREKLKDDEITVEQLDEAMKIVWPKIKAKQES